MSAAFSKVFERQHGDLRAIYAWLKVEDDPERVLILKPAYRRAGGFVIREALAFQYDQPETLADAAADACTVMGIEPNIRNAARVAGIIHEALPDLIRMAPVPPEMPKAAGELRILADGKEVGGAEVAANGDLLH